MSVFTSSPYLLAPNIIIVAKVQAHNKYGWSSYSPANTAGANVQTVPSQMPAPTRDSATTVNMIVVDWTGLSSPDNGYAPIASYNLQWDSGTSGALWSDLSGGSVPSTALTYTVSSSISAGSYYNFRVRASNTWGWGQFSSVTTVKAASSPA